MLVYLPAKAFRENITVRTVNVDFRLNQKNGTEEYGCRKPLRILRKLLK